MKRTVFHAMMAMGILGVVVNGCEVNPFSPPDKAKPSTESASSTSGSGMSSSGMAGGGGMGGGNGGAAGSGGSCVCADDNNPCTDDVTGNCPNGNPMACHTVKFAAQCPTGICDDKGECVDCLACADAACIDRCNGVTCAAGTECKSTYCEDTKCCNAACDGPCRACDKAGSEGTCMRAPVGLQVSGCDGNMLCSSDGTCVMQTKAALGALCNTSAQCESGLCRREYCQSPVGEPCVEDLECDSNLCDPMTKTCKLCTGADAGVCPTGSECIMASGRCKVFLGQPASTTEECVAGTVVQFLCALPQGAACNGHQECISRNCVNNICAPQCTNAGQCIEGGPCSGNGVCGMVAGSYCIINEHCKSGMCSGFPRKCQ